MDDREKKNTLEFEILKLVFFIVTYFLITDGIDLTAEEITRQSYSSFYNTLFIFSASTWIDYLSVLKFEKNRRYFSGSFDNSVCMTYVSLIGSIIGIFTVSISMYCVCKKELEYLMVAVVIYYISLIFIFLKAFVITNMVLEKITE